MDDLDFSDDDDDVSSDDFYDFDQVSKVNCANNVGKKEEEATRKALKAENDENKKVKKYEKQVTNSKRCAVDHQTIIINDNFKIKIETIQKTLFDLSVLTLKATTAAAAQQELETKAKKSTNDVNSFNYQGFKLVELRLYEIYDTCQEPAWLNLLLIENCKDYYLNKINTHAVAISKSFEKWCLRTTYDAKIVNKIKINLNFDLQLSAFKVATKHHILLLESIVRSYDLELIKNELYPHVVEEMKRFDYKDRAMCIACLNMQDFFDTKTILLPLLLQDKLNIIEKYLNRFRTQQIAFVEILDEICKQETDLTSYYIQYKVPNLKADKFNRRQLSKLALRLLKTFKIDPQHCPNINSQKYFKNLKFLVYKKYVERSIVGEAWDELICESLKQNDDLKESLLDLLYDYGDEEGVVKWFKYLKLDLNSIKSTSLKKHIESLINVQATTVISSTKQNEENWDENPNDRIIYKLKIKHEDVQFIDTKASLVDFINEISNLKNEKIKYVGVDSEWKPTCTMGIDVEEQKSISLLQVATIDRIYLLDFLTLTKIMDTDESDKIIKQFLCNQDIIKIGYGFTQDVKMISSCFDRKFDVESFRKTVLDMSVVVDQLLTLNHSIFPYTSHQIDANESTWARSTNTADISYIKQKGLSEAVRLCFGKILDKSEQMSNWNNRPLRRSQLIYASLDAYCLIEMFEFINERMKMLNVKIDFNTLIGKKLKMTSSSKAKIKENNKKAKEKNNVNKETMECNETHEDDQDLIINEVPIKPNELRVIVDNMLHGLGKELRRCGVDTIMIDNNQEHSDVARIARKENRYALTCGLPYTSIRSQLPEGRCINIMSGNARQQCAQVMKIFNVQVYVNDLFSRCRKCNTGSFTIIPKQVAKFLYYTYKNDKEKLKTINFKDIEKDLQVNPETMSLKKHPETRIQIENLFDTTIDVIERYYICDGCGHLYWEGPHWQNILNRFSHVLTTTNRAKEEEIEDDDEDEVEEEDGDDEEITFKN